MTPDAEQLGLSRTMSLPGQRDLTLIYQNETGRSKMAAKLLEFSEEYLGVGIENPLPPETYVEVVGEIQMAAGTQPLDRRGFVRWCSVAGNGRFVAGLFLCGETTKTNPDYYEFLQISPNAEPATIHRVFRYLASRFHPDVPGTGNAEKFLLLKEAYDVLSDPERRAQYDATYKKQGQSPLSQSIDFMGSVDGELNRRVAVLALLYIQRRIRPLAPEVSLPEVEWRMGFPRDYLDFTMWYLKSKKYITIADNSDFTITALGVDVVEANHDKIPLLNKLLSDGTASSTTEEVAAGKPLITPGKTALELPGIGGSEGISGNRDDGA
jgi:hypothetical protein